MSSLDLKLPSGDYDDLVDQISVEKAEYYNGRKKHVKLSLSFRPGDFEVAFVLTLKAQNFCFALAWQAMISAHLSAAPAALMVSF